MFPDQIDNNDDQSFERKTDSDGLNYVSFSIAEAWAKWGKGNIGDFIVPPEILAYVRKSRQDEEFGEKNIPGDAKRFEEAKEVAEECTEEEGGCSDWCRAELHAVCELFGWNNRFRYSGPSPQEAGGEPGYRESVICQQLL